MLYLRPSHHRWRCLADEGVSVDRVGLLALWRGMGEIERELHLPVSCSIRATEQAIVRRRRQAARSR